MNSFRIPIKPEKLEKLADTNLRIEIVEDEVLQEEDLDAIARILAECLYRMAE
jgi:nickel-dependent lactate racemase